MSFQKMRQQIEKLTRCSPLYVDNQATVIISKDPANHSKLKHESIRHFFVRDAVFNNLQRTLYPLRNPSIQIVQLTYNGNPSNSREEEDILRLRAFQDAAEAVKAHWVNRESELLFLIQEEKEKSAEWEQAAQDLCNELQAVKFHLSELETMKQSESLVFQEKVKKLQSRIYSQNRKLEEAQERENSILEELRKAKAEIEQLKKENGDLLKSQRKTEEKISQQAFAASSNSLHILENSRLDFNL